MNQTQPAPRFSDFFQTDAELVNEIPTRFRALQFAMVCQRRRSASQKLIGYVSARPRSRQRIDQANNPNGVLQQPFFKIKWSFTRNRGALIS